MNGTDGTERQLFGFSLGCKQPLIDTDSYLDHHAMAHLTKLPVYNIEDSNIALLGSDVSVPSIPDAIIKPCRHFVA